MTVRAGMAMKTQYYLLFNSIELSYLREDCENTVKDTLAGKLTDVPLKLRGTLVLCTACLYHCHSTSVLIEFGPFPAPSSFQLCFTQALSHVVSAANANDPYWFPGDGTSSCP